MREFTDEECLEIVRLADIPESIRRSSDRLATVFTQSWCGDWRWMRRYIMRIDDPRVEVLYVEYDTKPFFDEMKSTKEHEFKNGTIPYIRFYRGGELVNESNLIWSKRKFLKRFEKKQSAVSYR